MLFFLLALWILWEKLFNELIFEEGRKSQVRIKQANNLHERTKKYPNGKMNFIQLTKFGFFELAAPDSCWLHNSNVTFCHGKQQLCLQWGLGRAHEFLGLPVTCIQPSCSTGTLHRITAIGQTGLKKKQNKKKPTYNIDKYDVIYVVIPPPSTWFWALFPWRYSWKIFMIFMLMLLLSRVLPYHMGLLASVKYLTGKRVHEISEGLWILLYFLVR